MAGKKKNSDKAVGQGSINGISFLASGMACDMLAEQAMGGHQSSEPSPAIAAAWAELSSPSGVILAGLLDGDGLGRTLFIPAVGQYYRQQNRYATFGGGYGAKRSMALAAGLRELAAEIRSMGAQQPMIEAGACYGPMVARRSPQGIIFYPLMDSGLRPAVSSIGGAKRDLVAGGKLAGARGLDWNEQIDFKQMGELVASAKKVDEEDRDAISQEIKKSEAQARKLASFSKGATSASMHLALGAIDGGDVRGALTLPSLACMRAGLAAVAQKIETVPPVAEIYAGAQPARSGSVVEKLAIVAASRLVAAGMGALSVAWSGERRAGAGAVEREAMFGLLRGPYAQASASAWLSKNKDGVRAAFRPEELLIEAIWRLDAEGLGNCGWRLGAENHRNSVAGALETWLVHHAEGGDLAERVFAEAAALSQGEPDGQGAAVRLALREEIERFQGKKNGQAEVQRDADGLAGIPALAKELGKADPRIGLAQWAARAIKAIERAGAEGELQPFKSSESEEMFAALQEFAKALAEATLGFAHAAVAAAEPTENAWMAEAGLLAPWRQASATGLPSQESIVWAMDNPLGANLASHDPMARMGAKLSRALGLGMGTDDEVAAAVRAELGEWGLDENGWNRLRDDAPLRSWLEDLLAPIVGKGKVARELALAAAPVACQAISAGARLGLATKSLSEFAQCLAAMTSNDKRQVDVPLALIPRIGEVSLSSEAGALIAAELGEAKARSLSKLYDALGRDWAETLAGREELGISAASEAAASERMAEFVRCLSRSAAQNKIDWRVEGLFDARPIWSLLGGDSPRMGAVVAAAKKEGGLGDWCSEFASKYKIRDAADTNDLIGKVKVKIKEHLGMGEAAWKMAIKDPLALAVIKEAVGSWYASDSRLSLGAIGRLAEKDSEALAGKNEGGRGRSEATRMAFAFNCAAANGVSGSSASVVAAAFRRKRTSDALFSEGISSLNVASVDACLFFAREDEAKAKRMPKVFKEACARFEKLNKSWLDATARGDAELPLTGAEAIESEIGDLSDWLRSSEHGIWQNLPEAPTWGQLSRRSAEWHQEVAARAADMAARQEAVAKAKAEELRLNPFLPSAGEHWAAVLGTHSREGWEAVELTSQAQLTEEGQAMSHCVSSYASRCRNGELRIFSIKLNGERKCTMELSANKNLAILGEASEFSITQNKGAHNAGVTNLAAKAFCQEVVAAADASWSIGWRAREAAKAEEKEKKKSTQPRERSAARKP